MTAANASYSSLLKLDVRGLDKVLADMDFASRYEDKLKQYMETTLLTRMRAAADESDPANRVEGLITAAWDYYNRVFQVFNPYMVLRSQRLEGEGCEPSLRFLEIRETIDHDFRRSFMKHLRYCILDKFEYSRLFDEFME